MFRKRVEPAERPDESREFLRDLAVVYPEIETNYAEWPGYYIGQPPLWVQFRVSDIKRAAEAIRVAADQKAADALVKEFRGTKPRVTPSAD